MQHQDCTTSRFIDGPFGAKIPRSPASKKFCYLIHFHEPYKHARHYLGFSANVAARMALHRAGNGARLMEVITQAGISWELVRLWPVESCEEGHILERRLKNQHGGGRFCPLCNPGRVAPDVLVSLRQGHWPLSLHSQPGRRQPLTDRHPVFVRF